MSESTFELKEGKFTFFKTESKSKENSPDFTGKGMFEGVEVRLSGWAKKSESGKVYIQGSIQRPLAASASASTTDVDDFIGGSDPLNPTDSSDPLNDPEVPTPKKRKAPAEMLPGADGLPF